MQFYHNIITEKSFQELLALKQKYEFILIGGWAVFLYTRALKSKDIDIILDYEELARLKEKFAVTKNERLKKYEIKLEEVDIDIYLPHYSDLGIKAEEIKKKTILREGFNVPILEMLFLLKLYVWLERRGSVKGRKDELDIFSLAFLPEFDWRKYLSLIKRYNFTKYNQELISLLKDTISIKELNINEQKMARARKSILNELRAWK